MKITGPGQIQSKSLKKTEKKKSGDGAAFTRELTGSEASAPASATAGTAPVAPVPSILSIQEADTPTDGRSRGLVRAEDMLDKLEDIRRGLLAGSIPISKLRGLADLARRNRGATGDARLDSVLKDIELRAEVELAKFGA